MTRWNESQQQLEADIDSRVSKLQRMLSIYNCLGLRKKASQIPGRIFRLKSRLATINLNSFKNSFRKRA